MGKKAIVTGASRGIGRGIAVCLAKEGYDIFFTYKSKIDGALKTKALVEEQGVSCSFGQFDFEDQSAPEKAVKEGIRQLGGLDLIVCCAAVSDWTMIDNMLVYEDDRLRMMLNVDLWQYWICARTAARYYVKNKIKGNIIFISSPHAFRACLGDYVYGSIKAAINRSAQSFALDLAPYGIRTNCVSPGAVNIRTYEEMIAQGDTHEEAMARINLGKKFPGGRLGEPEDIGNAVVFLASDKASYITGRNLVVDGGSSIPAIVENPKDDDEEDLGWTYFRHPVPGEDW